MTFDTQRFEMRHDEHHYEYHASCLSGAESFLAAELASFGARRVRPLQAGVAFFGTLEVGYRACLWSRIASRILLIIDRVNAADAEELYASVVALPWERHIDPARTIAVAARGCNEKLTDTRFIALKVKDALCDCLREKYGVRPSVAKERPAVRIDVALRNFRATIALDLSGEPLHMRKYRVPSRRITAPLRETLAATMVMAAGWNSPDTAAARGLFLDPCCGSGTIVIEAALIALDRAPGILRDYWGFVGWLGHDEELWAKLLDEADERAERAAGAYLASGTSPAFCICARDIDSASVFVARESAGKAGVERFIRFAVADIADTTREFAGQELTCNVGSSVGQGVVGQGVAGQGVVPAATDVISGNAALSNIASGNITSGNAATNDTKRMCVVTNPPYGERLFALSQLPALYAAFRSFIDPALTKTPSDLIIITADEGMRVYLGQAPTRCIKTYNGALETEILIYAAPNGSEKASSSQQEGGPNAAPGDSLCGLSCDVSLPAPVTDPRDVEQFGNRLTKMFTHRAKWARRCDISCYRVYDADLPSFAVAIDLYEGAGPDKGRQWLHIAEYAPPKHIDATLATQRLTVALNLAQRIIGIPLTNIYLKTRQRAKGGSQYAVSSHTAAQPPEAPEKIDSKVISEGRLFFEVDFSSHLDTGIFLDHRLTRSFLRDYAAGKDALNLFAYTGTASVYMAAGGAKTVTSVDLSKTYLNIAQRNMKLNGFIGAQYRYERTDVVRWAYDHRHDKQKYGLIFCDAPTFSNSTSMGKRTWDVQRDHVELLITLSRMLTPDGVIVFSTNLRDFVLEPEPLRRAGVSVKDITAQTIPADFERNQKIHQCYLVSRLKVVSR